MIRLLLGEFKGRAINSIAAKNAPSGYRPTTAKHRQVIFNILQHSNKLPAIEIAGANVADICCGSGALGFESLSLGASNAVFVDIDRQSIVNINESAAQLKVKDKIMAFKEDATRLCAAPFQCDIIFLDPPYKQDIIQTCLQQLFTKGWLKDVHIIVLEGPRAQSTISLADFTVLDERTSGKTKLLFGCYNAIDH